jgi:hypothetical protein
VCKFKEIEMKLDQTNAICNSSAVPNRRRTALQIEKLGQLIEASTTKADHANNRFLLCKAMQMFANSCEARTKYLVPMFFRFIE